jgi:hypothetical protein
MNSNYIGIHCPRCADGKSYVVDSRNDDVKDVRRRRYECSCGERYTTYEIPAAEYEKVRAMRINTMQIDSTIATLRSIKAQFGATGATNGQN